MKALAFIPCRVSNNQRLPYKNLKTVGGVSLIGRAVEIARAAQSLGLVNSMQILASDHHTMMVRDAVGDQKLYSGELRAWPDSNARQVLREWLASLPESERPDLICQLLPTSPLRTLRHVVESRLLLTEGVEVVMSVTPFRQDVRGACRIVEHEDISLGTAEWVLKAFPGGVDGPLYKHCGSILWSRTEYVLSDQFEKCGWYPPQTVPYHVPSEDSADIDDELGLYLAECLLRRREGK